MQKRLYLMIPCVILLLVGWLASSYLLPREWSQMAWEIPGIPSEYPLAQMFRPWLIGFGCYLPALGAFIYAWMGVMDRYISRAFLNSFFLCTIILTLIWFLGDFTDNMRNFKDFKDPTSETIRFYGTQLPMVFNLILPYTLLLGTLWALAKLSGTSEITGMLQSGRSIMRLCIPILLYGSMVAIYYGIFAFHWAPNASLYRSLTMDAISKQRGGIHSDFSIVFKNEVDQRIWRAEKPPTINHPGEPFMGIVIEQFKAPGKIDYEIFAEEASWDAGTRIWTFKNANKRFHKDGYTGEDIPYFEDSTPKTLTSNFDETPWQIISPSKRVDTNGTPAIYEILKARTGNDKERRKMNTEWHVRIARIFSCIILILIAIPCAINFQRRSPMAGVGIAIGIAAAMLLFYEIFPTLASAGFLPCWLGAWLTNFIYIWMACYLFRKRLAHRSIKEWFLHWRAERGIH